MSVNAALTTLAQRELGPGYLVRVTDYPATYSERLELLVATPSVFDEGYSVFSVAGRDDLPYAQMVASELSICGQRRKALEALIADQLEAAA